MIPEEQAAKEQAAKEQAAKEQAAKEQAAKEQAAKEQAAKEQAAKEQAAKEQAAKEQAAKEQAAKSLHNTDQNGARKNVNDIQIFGEDLFVLLAKASSEKEGWMKSTKAMDVGSGCVVQVTTQQGDNVAEAVTFVPGVKILETVVDGEVIGRRLVKK